MQQIPLIFRATGLRLCLGMALSLGMTPWTVAQAQSLDPEADAILRSMTTYLANTDSFSVNADIDFEVVVRNGQKLQLSSYATVLLDRPNGLYIQRWGPLAQAEIFFDGNQFTVFSQPLNAYAQRAITGTIDDAIRAFELETGIPAPGGDFLFADPYAVFSEGVTSSAYLGTAYINGVEAHHLAFREAEVDWQLWVQTGDQPLPLKYVVTTKWVTGAPQYEIRLRDWATNPSIGSDRFTFMPPAGATPVEVLPAME